ncbi:hypothetical protein [Pseudarthrobacter sp. MDT3-1]
MSALWGTRTQRTRVLFVSAALVVSLTGCEHGGPAEGAAGSSSQGATAQPGKYKLHFLCEGPADVELSLASWAGAAVLEPVRVACDGGVFAAQVKLDTDGADFTMNPGSGPDGRYAFRLVPAS